MDSPTLAVVFILGSAVLHALWNALVKAGGDRLSELIFVFGFGALSGLVVAPFVPFPDAGAWPFIVASALIHVGYMFFLAEAYRFGDLSRVYPLARGMVPLVVAGAAPAFAGETLGPFQFAGIALISIGIASLAFERRTFDDPRSVGLAIATGLIVGTLTLNDGIGVRQTEDALSYMAWVFMIDGPIMATVAWLARGRLFLVYLRSRWRVMIGAGVVSTASYGLAIAAFKLGALAPVAALRETSVIIAALIGTLFMGEPFGRRRLIAATIVVAGTVVMNLRG
ncbi:MAG: EamA family transporter [Alphaproteobacteria bacterium]|nr:EamA family transporter [Alphaproteobacteria bacterium]